MNIAIETKINVRNTPSVTTKSIPFFIDGRRKTNASTANGNKSKMFGNRYSMCETNFFGVGNKYNVNE